MISLGKFEDLQHEIFSGIERVNRLEVLRQKLVDFQDLIFADAVSNDLDYRANDYVDELQDPLENLTARIESLIAAQKRNVEDCHRELLKDLFVDENGVAWTQSI